jgi:Tol biopolymer transport system component
MVLQAGFRLGTYEVMGLLGAGGMGEVYAARDTTLGRCVALKVLPERFSSDPQRLDRFRREARVLASLNHPCIAAIYGLEGDASTPVLVLELVAGPTLADRIAEGPLPTDDVLRIARQTANALESAHEQGIIHRDLKPSNIKLRPDGTVKLLDFGLAKILDPSRTGTRRDEPTVTAPLDVIMGTAAYMSPEQARGQAIDRRADIWAFGCVLYEMITGLRPFGGDAPSQTIAHVVGSEPDWAMLPEGLPPALQACVRGCLRKDPKERVRDIGDVRLALESSFEIMRGSEANGPRPVQRETWRRALRWVAVTLIASAATGVAGWRLASVRDDRPIEFLVHPPDGGQFERRSMAPLPALSRDGRYLAFVAPLKSRSVVWVQALGDLQARALPGSEEAVFPFWSPEADFIGFAGGGRLKKIAVSGSHAPQDLCTCDAAWGGTWSANGTVIFAGDSGLYRVSAAGGDPVSLTRVDRARGEFSHRYPFMLPDGRRFLYLVRSTEDAQRGVYLGSLDEPGLKQPLVPDDSNASYGIGPNRQMYLFFVRGFNLLAQPFDLSRGVTGDAIVVARSIIPGETGRFAPFAAGGRTLVYRQRPLAQTRLVWRDRRGDPGGTIGRPGADYAYPALSPDGTRLAIAHRDPATGHRDIWVIDIDRPPVEERLTEDPVTAGFPLWAPDGSKVLYASTRSGPWDLYWRSTNENGGAESLFHAPTSEPLAGLGLAAELGVNGRPRDITVDGRFLLFSRQRDLWMRSLDGTSRSHLLVRGSHGRVSPDGRWLAYTSTERGARDVYVTTFPTPTNRWRISTAGGEDPQWRRDGTELYYIAADQALTAVAIRDAAGTGSFEHVVPETLFRAPFDRFSLDFGSGYCPAPDGGRFLVLESLHDEAPLLTATINWSPGRAH